jgi:hypothetical protein
MSKELKTKSDVVEWYWPDFLAFCLRSRKRIVPKLGYSLPVDPTIKNFWIWYITDGPLGLKDDGHFYSKDEVKYV